MVKRELYLIIADKIKEQINLNIYQVDQPLPSCRMIALKFGVNPNTVQKAYNYLEEQKVLYSIPKKGYFLNKEGSKFVKPNYIEKIIELKNDGLEYDEALRLLEKVYKGGIEC